VDEHLHPLTYPHELNPLKLLQGPLKLDASLRIEREQRVRIEVEDEAVTVDLYVIVEPGVNMHNLGQTIQAEVTRAINDMVGVAVRAVNIHIQDVEEPLLDA